MDDRRAIIQRLIHLLHRRIAYLEDKLGRSNEVVWVERNERANPYERIRRLGGRHWTSSPKNMIENIESRGLKFYIKRGERRIDVVVAISPAGYKYLKTAEDKDVPGKLLTLPDGWSYHDNDPDTPWTSNRSLIKNGKSLKPK
jgi:hypothetical protein